MNQFSPKQDYFEEALRHQKQHRCTGVPYDQGKFLTTLVAAIKPERVLELGTGIGYSTFCIALGNNEARIETIDQDELHTSLAKEYWEKFGISNNISVYNDKAEGVLPSLTGPYDLIFFDGKEPSMKFLIHFERLLRHGGLLITANIYLKDPKGGAYVRHINNQKKWQTEIVGDTSLSVKLK